MKAKTIIQSILTSFFIHNNVIVDLLSYEKYLQKCLIYDELSKYALKILCSLNEIMSKYSKI